MSRFTPLALLFALPLAAFAASSDPANSASSDKTSANESSSYFARQAVATTKSPDQLEHGTIVGSIAFTGVYTKQFTKQQPVMGTANHGDKTLAGWAITPEVNFTKHIGLQADFMNSMTSDSYPGANKFMIAAGPRYTFNPYWKGTPFVFGEAGEVRTTYGRWVGGKTPSTSWNPVASAGVGFDLKVSPNFAIQIVPGEWTGERFDYNGTWQNNYQARLGFVFNLRK